MDSVGSTLVELGLGELGATAQRLATELDAFHDQVEVAAVTVPKTAELSGELNQGSLEGLQLEESDVVEVLLADGTWLPGRFGYFRREGTVTAFDWALKVRFPSSKGTFVECVMALPFRAFARLVDDPERPHPGEPKERTSIKWRDYDHFFENEELKEGDPLEVLIDGGRWLRGVYGKGRERRYGVALLQIHFGRGSLGEDARLDEDHWLPIPQGAYVRRPA